MKTAQQARNVVRKMLAEAEKEQATHKRRWGPCFSTCETVQRIAVLNDVLEALGARGYGRGT